MSLAPQKARTTSPITWTTTTDANVLLAAIKSTVNTFGDVSGPRTGDVFVPRGVANSVDVISSAGLNFPGTNYGGWYSDRVSPAFIINEANVLAADAAWVTATAVPEPNAFLCLGVVGLGIVTWKKLKSKYRRPT